MSDAAKLTDQLKELQQDLLPQLIEKSSAVEAAQTHVGVDPFVFGLSVLVLACFVGYFVVWKVTPALHTPLMAVTNAISGIIVLGAMIAVGAAGASGGTSFFGFLAVVLASINIFGGFVVTRRMLEMFKKKEKRT